MHGHHAVCGVAAVVTCGFVDNGVRQDEVVDGMVSDKPTIIPFRSMSIATLITATTIILILASKVSNAFSPAAVVCPVIKRATNSNPVQNHDIPHPLPSSRSVLSMLTSTQSIVTDDFDTGDWIPLISDERKQLLAPVRKRILSEGEGDLPSGKITTIEIQYTGSLLGERNHWSTNDVTECWSSQLQGLDYLIPKFLENDIDGRKLMDESYFTEDFCTNTLGMENKIQAKKLVMASRRLVRQQVEYPSGTIFDESTAAGKNYAFVLEEGTKAKVIPAMELSVRSMKVGERSLLICRSDYAYGSEGLRSSKGEVVVPPFAMLCFDLTLASANAVM
jgi:hypothetical protein